MKEYEPKNFFIVNKDKYNNLETKLLPPGVKLLTQYYEQKHKTEIQFADTASSDEAARFEKRAEYIKDALNE